MLFHVVCPGINGEIGKGHDFTIFCNGKIFVVAVCPASSPDDQVTLTLARYNTAILRNDRKAEREIEGEVEDMIAEGGWRTFAHLAPAISSAKSPPDLHSDFNPETFYFRLVLARGRVELVQKSPPPPRRPFRLAISDASNLPRYSARDISVLEKFPGVGYIAKVSANWQDACCKIAKTI
ncbi:hypothetical protein VF21_10120 [Pseudogymnoascus sp. 05NY08]|nr:hypothetical protein VF21_10120 [Pseudogymnoascus sp. 05NY08]